MRRAIFAITIVAVVGIFLVLTYFFFYPGRYQPPSTEKPRFEDITVPTPVSQPFAEEYRKQKGTLLLDVVHDNNFTPRELDLLLSRVISQGFVAEFLKEPTTAQEEVKAQAAERLERMREKLRYADAMAVILPREAFSSDEVKVIKEFVEKGGKLLLVADPTRPSQINTVSTEFGLTFEADYLYNLKDYDGNYQNIFITEFTQADVFTQNLAKIVLYSAGSISSSDKGIAFTDENTLSSLIQTKRTHSPIALTEGSKVLAISDFTFMREPFSAVWDNNQLISNIAEWLTRSERVFFLSDFPYFLEDKAYIAYGNPVMIDLGVELKNFLVEKGKSPELGQYEDMLATSRDVVFLGLFKEAGKVENYLERGKISVRVKMEVAREKKSAKEEKPQAETENVTSQEITITEVEIGNIGQVYREEGTSILYLDQKDNRDVLIILSDSKEMMKDTIDALIKGKFRDWLISDKLVVYYAEKAEVKGS